MKLTRKQQTFLAKFVVYVAFSTIIGQTVIQLPVSYQIVFAIALCIASVGVLVWVIYKMHFQRDKH